MAYLTRPMTRAELDLALEWAAQEGWNPGPRDGDCFWAADPGGFLIGELNGAPIASISVVRFGSGYGFLGFYLVRPEHRGGGHGLRLWRDGMARLGERVVGLDGVPAQQDNYRRSGFALAHRNIRYGGSVAAPGEAKGLIDLAQVPFAQTLAYDAGCSPARREAFLRAWIAAPGHVGRAALRGGEVCGFGVARPCRQGWKVGPLFADDAAAADPLFRALAAPAEGAPVFLDVPEPNAAARALAERHGLAPVFETARMYRGPAPRLPLGRIFGVASFELG